MGNSSAALLWSVRLGEEGDLPGRIVLAEELDAFAPRGFLEAVEFAEIEDVALDDAPVVQSAILDNTPVEVLFAIFATFGTTQKHDGVGSYRKNPEAEEGGSALQALSSNGPL